MEAIQIKFEGLTLECNYIHSEGEKETRDNPEIHEEAEVTEIFYNGNDVTDIYFSLVKETEIENTILTTLSEDYA